MIFDSIKKIVTNWNGFDLSLKNNCSTITNGKTKQMKELTVTKIHFHSLHPSNNTKIFFKKNINRCKVLLHCQTRTPYLHQATLQHLKAFPVYNWRTRLIVLCLRNPHLHFQKKKNKCLIISIPYNLTISKQHSTVSTNTRGCHRQFIITSYTNPKCTVHATSYILNSVGDWDQGNKSKNLITGMISLVMQFNKVHGTSLIRIH